MYNFISTNDKQCFMRRKRSKKPLENVYGLFIDFFYINTYIIINLMIVILLI